MDLDTSRKVEMISQGYTSDVVEDIGNEADLKMESDSNGLSNDGPEDNKISSPAKMVQPVECGTSGVLISIKGCSNPPLNDDSRFPCVSCEFMGQNAEHLLLHQAQHSDNKPHASSLEWECSQCLFTGKLRSSLISHMCAHKRMPFACIECEYTSNRETHLKIHMKKHDTLRLFACNTCSHREANFEGISAHGNLHGGFVPNCAMCPFASTSRQLLNDHVAKHTNIKEFKCEICPYSSNAACILKRHVRTHTGEKPYACDVCEYRGTDAGLLKRHKRTHTGERPFRCAVCGYKCSQASTLQSHIWTHNGQKPFTCSLCDYKCNRALNLKNHMWKHDGRKLYPCSSCEFKCTTAGNLKAHVARKHPGLLATEENVAARNGK